MDQKDQRGLSTLCNCVHDPDYDSDCDQYGQDEYSLPLHDKDGGWDSGKYLCFGGDGGGKRRRSRIRHRPSPESESDGRVPEDFELDDMGLLEGN